MNSGDSGSFWQSKWKFLVIYLGFIVAVAVVVLLAFTTNIFRTAEVGAIPQIIWLLAAAVFLLAFILMLAKVLRIVDILDDNSAKLARIAEQLERNRAVLEQIDQGVKLSETAKMVLSGQTERQSVRDAVYARLEQKDFHGANEIIDEISHHRGYKELAEQLRKQAEAYSRSADQGSVRLTSEQVGKLLEDYRWAEASEQIEALIKSNPDSEEAKALRRRLVDKKEERKKVLLNAWDDAVKRGATDRSLEILKELDQYLTPNEGLALQEAARDIFKTKLHNLGIQFSLAVSGSNWAQALAIGGQIMRDFPNSKMAGEIREKVDVLQQKVGEQAG